MAMLNNQIVDILGNIRMLIFQLIQISHRVICETTCIHAHMHIYGYESGR